RWALASMLVLLPILVLLHAVIDSRGLGEYLRVFELLLFLFSITTLFWTFCYVEIDARGRHAGFPSRMFTLPVNTLTLAGLPMAYGAVAVAVFYLLWTALIFPTWDVRMEPSWIRAHVLSLIAMLLCLQAIVWSLYRFPWIRFALVLISLVGLGFVGILTPAEDFRKMSEVQVLGFMTVVALLAFLGALAGVARDRRGEWDGWTRRLLDAIHNWLPHRRQGFASPADAQVWFEWRGKGLFFSLMLGLGMAGTMIIFPLPTALRADPVMSAIMYANFPILTLVAAWALGMTLARTDYWSRDPLLSPFITTRPLLSGDILIAKVKTAAIIFFVAAIIFAILAVPVFNLPHYFTNSDVEFPSWRQFVRDNPALFLWITNPIILLTGFAVVVMTMVDGLAIGLSGFPKSVVKSVSRVVLFIGALVFVQWLAHRPGGMRLLLQSLPWVSASLITWKLTSTITLFSRVLRLHSPLQLASLAALWLLTWGLLSWSAALVWTDLAAANRVITFVVAFLGPGASTVRCTLNLHARRHP
ncbi:MAG: hypothetical protein L0Y58_19315, partial [Verrucomicrobia subdivision 3 bacterium]|nr:hypothetical protein [Limisphaerales bacterium]